MNTKVNVKNGDKLSILGFGCMRYPMKGNRIDEERTIKLIREAYESGINYFDTAYPYHGGKSEPILGKALVGIRENVNIATKMPQFMIKTLEQAMKIFETQLERLQTNYIDYYLVHMLTDHASFDHMVNLGVIEFLQQKKDAGVIKNFGFSFHGAKDDFIKILKAYPWDFCQIQYNYLDEHNQATIDGLKLAYAMNIPVIVMEPLRGGRLVNSLPQEVIQSFDTYHPKRTAVEWSLRWIWNHPEVNVILSGMSNEEQLHENVSIASSALPGQMDKEELNIIKNAQKIMLEKTKVPCTGCGYCMPCPKGVNIPGVFAFYNDKYLLGPKGTTLHYLAHLGITGSETHYANQCVSCGLCEEHCPQEIKIRQELKNAEKELEPFWFKPLVRTARFFMGKNKKKKLPR